MKMKVVEPGYYTVGSKRYNLHIGDTVEIEEGMFTVTQNETLQEPSAPVQEDAIQELVLWAKIHMMQSNPYQAKLIAALEILKESLPHLEAACEYYEERLGYNYTSEIRQLIIRQLIIKAERTFPGSTHEQD